MKLKIQTLLIALSASLAMPDPASAAVLYNQNVIAIFGAGNPNTGWATDSNNGLVLGLRAKNRETGSTANVNGVYAEPAGYQAPALTRARWNFEWSVDSGGVSLDNYEVYVSIDNDPSVGISENVVPMADIPDNSFGNSTTANSAGVEGLWATLAPANSVAQQSHNITFYPSLGFDPNANATYEFEVYAVAAGDGPDGEKLASVSITVVVGTGGQTVQQLIDAIGAGWTGTHGQYVVEVDALLDSLYDDGVINKKERKQYHVAAAQSSIGK